MDEENILKGWHIPRDRFMIILVVMLVMWGGIMVLFYLKADEVTKHPCSVCAKKIGNDVFCTTYTDNLKQEIVIFQPNMTIDYPNARI